MAVGAELVANSYKSFARILPLVRVEGSTPGRKVGEHKLPLAKRLGGLRTNNPKLL